jgi:hypothetical protein
MNTKADNILDGLWVWPADQKADKFCEEPTMVVTDFEDAQDLNRKIYDRILELEEEGSLVHTFANAGSKVRHVHKWGCPEADFLEERVKYLFEYLTGRKARIDLGWANVNRKYNYLAGHSHLGTLASIVYMLEPGDPPTEEYPLSGRLSFLDPRIPACCPDEPDRLTLEVHADMKAGTMVMFPAWVVHQVHPYFGDKTRITLAWNVNPAD